MADEIQTGDDAPGTISLSSLADVGKLIQNLDIMSAVKKYVDKLPDSEETFGMKEKLAELMSKYDSMTEKEKEDFSAKIKEQVANKFSLKLDNPDVFKNLEKALNDAVMVQVYWIAAGVILLVILIVFFGYKLYKSIKEKELKKEEKKKAKLLKKKK